MTRRHTAYHTLARLSSAAKMPCPSWGLPARRTCPGAIIDGTLTDRCRTCYAGQGRFTRSNVKQFLATNMTDWQTPDWTTRMIAAIAHLPFFRWFHSGDGYKRALWDKIYEICKATPNTRHWIPTSVHETGAFDDELARLETLPNVRLRRSSPDHDTFEPHHGSMVYTTQKPPQGVTPCMATKDHGCGDCRACWGNEAVIGYRHHGQARPATVIKLWRKE